MARRSEVDADLGIEDLIVVTVRVSRASLETFHELCSVTGYPVAVTGRDCFLFGMNALIQERMKVLDWQAAELASDSAPSDDT